MTLHVCPAFDLNEKHDSQDLTCFEGGMSNLNFHMSDT